MAKVWLKDKQKRQRIDSSSFRIGSHVSNQLVLDGAGVADVHAEIQKDARGFRLVSLGPEVFVNNLAVEKESLAHGDVIRIGDVELVFDDPPAAADDYLPPPPDQDFYNLEELSEMEIARPVSEFEPVVEELFSLPKGKSRDIAGPGLDASETIAAEKNLFLLYKVARSLNSTRALPDVLSSSLDIILNQVGASRGGVFLLDETADMELLVSRDMPVESSHDMETIREIIRTSIMENTARLCADACYDPDFAGEDSVSAAELHSVICIPLWDSEEILGALYLDKQMESYVFNQQDLELLTAVAGQIAVKVRQEQIQSQMRENALLQANLERFHSPDVARLILDQSRQEGETSFLREKEVTILFADISNFTSLLERLEPGRAADLLNSFFDEMTSIIFKYRGTVDKFIGDAIMANFGAPISHGNDAELAIFSAIDMMRKMEEFKASQKDEEKFDIRIGINTGVVIAGYIGSRTRIEYSVLGDPVNVAARIQHIASPGSILAGESTYAKVSNLFHFRDKGISNLKGKKQTTRVYEVVY